MGASWVLTETEVSTSTLSPLVPTVSPKYFTSSPQVLQLYLHGMLGKGVDKLVLLLRVNVFQLRPTVREENSLKSKISLILESMASIWLSRVAELEKAGSLIRFKTWSMAPLSEALCQRPGPPGRTARP